MTVRVHRYPDAEALYDAVAAALTARLAAWPPRGRAFSLCVSDGLAPLGPAVESHLPTTGANPARLALWWSDDRFVDITHQARVSTRTLSALGGIRLAPSNVHPMPTPSGFADADAAAMQYAAELGKTGFDVALLAMADNGGVAGLQPGSAAFTDNPPHAVATLSGRQGERLTLTLSALGRSAAVWLIATGEQSAETLRRVCADDAALPAGALRGRHETVVFADKEAASLLPWHVCDL